MKRFVYNKIPLQAKLYCRIAKQSVQTFVYMLLSQKAL